MGAAAATARTTIVGVLAAAGLDGAGDTQPGQRRPVAPSGATGWHTIAVDVTA